VIVSAKVQMLCSEATADELKALASRAAGDQADVAWEIDTDGKPVLRLTVGGRFAESVLRRAVELLPEDSPVPSR
jgi:hypothetical protein